MFFSAYIYLYIYTLFPRSNHQIHTTLFDTPRTQLVQSTQSPYTTTLGREKGLKMIQGEEEWRKQDVRVVRKGEWGGMGTAAAKVRARGNFGVAQNVGWERVVRCNIPWSVPLMK